MKVECVRPKGFYTTFVSPAVAALCNLIGQLDAACMTQPDFTHTCITKMIAFRNALRPKFHSWARSWTTARGRGASSTSASELVTVDHTTTADDRHSVATVTLNRPPVNSLNTTLTERLTATLQDLDRSGSADAVIIRSSLPTVFSAGLDLNDLYNKPRPHLVLFWQQVQQLWFQLYSSRLAVVAAINGHCFAAGTVIAGACDQRIAALGSYHIGVHAASIGLIAPPWFLKMLTYLMGQRLTEAALQQGRLFSPADAEAVGLVDKVCEPGKLEAASIDALTPYLSVSQESRSRMKLSLRRELIDQFLASRDQDTEEMVSFFQRDSVQQRLWEQLEKLKNKK